MTTYFHVAELLEGDVLRARFGQSLRPIAEDPLTNRERVFEAIRSAEYPHHPSRLTSSFLFGSLADAVAYSELAEFSGKQIYRVEAPDDAATFRGDLMWAVRGQQGHIALEEAARGYWSGRPFYGFGWYEVLCPPPIRIIGVVPEEDISPHRGQVEDDTGQGIGDVEPR